MFPRRYTIRHRLVYVPNRAMKPGLKNSETPPIGMIHRLFDGILLWCPTGVRVNQARHAQAVQGSAPRREKNAAMPAVTEERSSKQTAETVWRYRHSLRIRSRRLCERLILGSLKARHVSISDQPFDC